MLAVTQRNGHHVDLRTSSRDGAAQRDSELDSCHGWAGSADAGDRERVHQAPPWAGTTYSASLTFSDGSEMDYGHKHATREEAEECARITMAGRR